MIHLATQRSLSCMNSEISKPTFRNYHKQKYTLLSKIATKITQWTTTTHKTHKFRQMPGKTPMWGNPTREREREIYYSTSGKYISAAAIQFPAREKYLTAPKTVPKFCLDFRAQKIRTAVRICPLPAPRNLCQITYVRTATETALYTNRKY